MLPSAPDGSHANYGAQDMNFGRFFKAATQTGRRLLKEVFLLMFYRSRVVACEWPTTVPDYCFRFLSWSNGRYRDCFSAEERVLLEQPVGSGDFDVTLLFKVFHRLFSGLGLPESFWRALRDMKNVRNRVCHQQLALDRAQLRGAFDDLEAVFGSLLEEASDFFSADTRHLREAFRREAEEILLCPVSEDAFEYFQRAEEFRAYVVGRFIACGRQELEARYQGLKVLNPFTWLSDDHFGEMRVDKIFTPLHLSTEQDWRVDISSLLEASFGREGQIPPSVLLLSGIAGSGKTSLCRYLLHEWRTGSGRVASLRSADVLLHVEARSVACGGLLPHLRGTLLRETCGRFQEKDVIEALQQMNVLYVIDGMDEATSDGRRLVDEVLSLLGHSRAVITTRPECSSALIQAVQSHQLSHAKLDVRGFSSEGMTRFTSLVFSSMKAGGGLEEEEEEFLRFLKKAMGSLGDHLRLPLTLVLLICLWREDKSRLSRVTSATRLYSEIFKMCTMKMVSRLQSTSSLHQMELEAFAEEWLLALGKEAFSMLEGDEYVLSDRTRKELVSLCLARQIDSLHVFSSFMACEVESDLKGVRHLFSFIHKSQMEYLAAKYVSHRICSRQKNVASLLQRLEAPISKRILRLTISDVAVTTYSHKWLNTLCFVVGHLCVVDERPDPKIRKVVGTLLSSHIYLRDVLNLWRIVRESDCHPTVCEMAGSAVDKTFVWRPMDEELCDPSVSAVLQMLQHTAFAPKRAVLRITGRPEEVVLPTGKGRTETRPCETLVPILACLSSRPSVNVELALEKHFYEWGSPDTTDGLLTALLPGANLVSLVGHVGVEGAAALVQAEGVQEAFLRVSQPEVLRVLAASEAEIRRLTLRLDVPQELLPPESLKSFVRPPQELRVVLWGVDDRGASWAGGVLAGLGSSYEEVDLVASRLTPSGGEALLRVLLEEGVEVSGRLTVRSVHRLQEEGYQRMSKFVEGSFAWWS